jgi:prepilin peptidase CpaA
MQGGYFSYGLLTALAIALATAAVTDFRRRQIDNWLNAGIALCAPLYWYASGMSLADAGWQLGTALAAFAVLAVFFALRAMGGGDVKLLTAIALWIKPAWFLELIVIMSLIGGLLTVVFGAWHIARRQSGRPMVPYGIAISCAGLWVLASHYLPAGQLGTVLG